jgi:hypothetical protein
MISFVVVGTSLFADRSKQEISMSIRMEHVSGGFWLAILAALNRDERDNEVVRAEFQVSADGESPTFGIELEPMMNGEKYGLQRYLLLINSFHNLRHCTPAWAR